MPSWSSDGRWIYFSSNRTGTWEIWKVAPQGGPAAQVTNNGGFEAWESSDGKFLYYTKVLGTAPLWRMPVEGGEETRIFAENIVGRYWRVLPNGICFLKWYANPPEIDFFDFVTHGLRKIGTVDRAKGLHGGGGFTVSPDS